MNIQKHYEDNEIKFSLFYEEIGLDKNIKIILHLQPESKNYFINSLYLVFNIIDIIYSFDLN